MVILFVEYVCVTVCQYRNKEEAQINNTISISHIMRHITSYQLAQDQFRTKRDEN